jgi:hypothetical protein
MEPEVKQDTTPEYVDVTVTSQKEGGLIKVSDSTNEQLRKVGEQVSAFLAELPEFLADFFGEYKRPLITVGLIIAAFIAVKLVLAILGAINDIPLLSPLFELIGMGYAAWFVYRYLWKASNRKELAADFNALKEQVLGKGTTLEG